MPLARKTKTALRVTTIILTSTLSMAAAVIGTMIGMQGGNFWPWVFASLGVYVVELTYISIIWVRQSRQPEQQRIRTLQKRRQARREAAQ